MPCCRRRSARAAATRAACPMPGRWPPARPTQPLPARRRRNHRATGRAAGPAAIAAGPEPAAASRRRCWRGSTRRAASAAPVACRPARPTRSSARAGCCTPCSPSDCMGCELCVAACPADCIVHPPRAAADGAAPRRRTTTAARYDATSSARGSVRGAGGAAGRAQARGMRRPIAPRRRHDPARTPRDLSSAARRQSGSRRTELGTTTRRSSCWSR